MDSLTPAERSERMSRIRGRGMVPEIRIRSLFHSLGYRFRLHVDMPGHPDLAFASKKKVIFVHGCYWHRHACPMGRRMPKSRLEFWRPKLLGNARRDRENLKRLAHLGWLALVIWECETSDPESLARRITRFLEKQ
jgi:DNA mismatch endonuclease (patch repair protein)